jgi:putative membrane protein
MRLIVSLIINVVAVYVASYILPGVHVDSVTTVVVVAIVLGVINTFLRPLLLLLTLPITVITLGLFTLVVNGLLVLLVTWFVPGFHVDNFLWAVGFSIVVSLVSWFLSKLS